jgi:hypothetical protein
MNALTDKDAALKAVQQNGRALQYASDELRADTDFIIHVARDWVE